MVALSDYIQSTRRLLQNPPAPTSLYATSDLTAYINTARGQLAGDAECIRLQATISCVVGTRVYNFSGLNTGVSATNGIQGVLSLRQMLYSVASGQQWVRPRGFEWFTLYKLNNPVPSSGPPQVWSQYGQGASGSFYIDPLPDDTFTLSVDAVCYPIPLVDDNTVDAIPYIYSDAVPYFAAYMAFLSAQSGARQNDANRMLELYTEFKNRARRFSNSTVLPYSQPQTTDPTTVNQLGLQQPRVQ